MDKRLHKSVDNLPFFGEPFSKILCLYFFNSFELWFSAKTCTAKCTYPCLYVLQNMYVHLSEFLNLYAHLSVFPNLYVACMCSCLCSQTCMCNCMCSQKYTRLACIFFCPGPYIVVAATPPLYPTPWKLSSLAWNKLLDPPFVWKVATTRLTGLSALQVLF